MKISGTAFLLSFLVFSNNSYAFLSKKWENSFAYEVAKAGKITGGPLKDIFPKDLDKYTHGKVSPDALGLVTGVAMMADGMSSVPDFLGGNSLAGGIFIFDSLFNEKGKWSKWTQVLAWMPLDMAADKKEASEKLQSVIKEAVMSSIPEKFSGTIKTRAEVFGETGKKSDTHKFVHILGPGCDVYVCGFNWIGLSNHTDYQARGIKESTPKIIRKILNSDEKKSWAWYQGRLNMGISRSDADSIRDKTRPEHPYKDFSYEFYQEVSQKLPEWAFIYIAPNPYRPLPAIFHQGKMHLFVKKKVVKEEN